LAVNGIINSTNGGGKHTMKKDSGGSKFFFVTSCHVEIRSRQ
jgi:hypothetical protein